MLYPMKTKIRLYVDQTLSEGQTVPLTHQKAHYLFCVMRMSVGDNIALFNGYNGEWSANIVDAKKKTGLLKCTSQTKPQKNPPDLWLLFAPIKKMRTDFIIEKATELGAARIIPIKTENTNSKRIQRDRLQAHAIEAAEQCGGTFVPVIENFQRWDKILSNWPVDRNLLFCDEGQIGKSVEINNIPFGKCAVLIGPEGGFSQDERDRIATIKSSYPFSLGPRILRADTAAVVALSLWQTIRGDWK